MTINEAANSIVRDSARNSIHPYAPKPEQFSIEAIAHGLSMQCRFNGHIDEFYSVAQHSVYVSRLCRLQEARMWGLLHDAAEYVIGDIPTPVKRYLPPEVEEVEENIARAICERFAVERGEGIDADVKRADYTMLLAEAMTLHPDRVNNLELWNLKTDRPITEYSILKTVDPLFFPWSPSFARAQFIAEFYAIRTEKPSMFLAQALS